MKGITSFLILNIVNLVLSKTCVIDNRSSENTMEEKLVTDIMSDYNTFKAPCSTVSVTLRFRIRRFNFDSELGTFSTYNMLYVSWMDNRMQWDPNKYDQLNSTTLKSFDLWTPNIYLINGDSNDLYYFLLTNCIIKSSGRVVCATSINYKVMCETAMKYWPFDRQNCSMKFGASYWQNYEVKLKLKFNKFKNLIIVRNGAEWDIVDYEQREDSDSKEQLHMGFILERQAGSLSAIIIYPSIILTLLTVIVLTLDVRSDIRFNLACFSVLCHFYFLSELGEVMPKCSYDTPIIVLYYRGSLLLTLIALILTSLLKVLCEKETPIPHWISSVNNFIMEGKWKLIILPRWYNDNSISENASARQYWNNFANILNSLAIFLFVFIYLCLYIAFVPSPARVANINFEH